MIACILRMWSFDSAWTRSTGHFSIVLHVLQHAQPVMPPWIQRGTLTLRTRTRTVCILVQICSTSIYLIRLQSCPAKTGHHEAQYIAVSTQNMPVQKL